MAASAALLAVGFLPLFAGPGYESSLAGGLVLPLATAVSVAMEGRSRQAQPAAAWKRALESGALFALVGYGTTLLHGARAGFCDFASGSVHFALTAGMGALMGAAWGSCAGELAGSVRRPWLRATCTLLLSLLGPLFGILLSALRFLTSPIIFAFDPFFGFFSGTLYDTVIEATSPLLTYRLGSACTLLALSAACFHLQRSEQEGLSLVGRGAPWIAGGGALAAVLSFVLVLFGARLGHFQTAETIASELGGRSSGKYCDVMYSRSIRREDTALFVKDCDEQVAAIERFFDLPRSGRYTAYLFRDSSEKKRLMGAGDTYIAKPWRREVYLQAASYPHPVLGHELAHAISSNFAKGPLRIAGRWGGLLANPGLIEGVAVAASQEDQELTPAEWSRSMLDLSILPPLKRVFALGFLGENASKSYTVAGAFVSFVRDTFGNQVLERWYAGEPIEQLTGLSFDTLEARWKNSLSTLTIPASAQAIAKARFDRPSVFGRRCPHVVDSLKRDAEREQGRGDYQEAIADYEHVLRLDPHDDATRLAQVTCFLREGSLEDARTLLLALARDPAAPRTVRDRAQTLLADLDLATGSRDAAGQIYGELISRTLDEDASRTLEVKMKAASDPLVGKAIVALLIGTPERGVDSVSAAALLGSWIGEAPTDGLPEYLLARGAISRGLYAEAAQRLDRALMKRLAPGRIVREALRQRTIVGCALGDVLGARRAYHIWQEQDEPSLARREAMARFVERCAPLAGDR